MIRFLLLLWIAVSLFSCSSDPVELPAGTHPEIELFDRIASEQGLDITEKLIGFEIDVEEVCDIEIDCNTKQIRIPKDIEPRNVAIYQALAQCVLGRTKEEAQMKQGVLTSIMQINFTPCANFQCTPTILFDGSYKKYYLDELFGKEVDLDDYVQIERIPYESLDRSEIVFDDCQKLSQDELGSVSYLHEHVIEAIPYSDSLRFNSGNKEFHMLYSNKCCDYLAGYLFTGFSIFYTGKIIDNMDDIISKPFKITYYQTEDRFYLYIDEELVQAYEIPLKSFPASYSSTYLDELFGENCHIQVGHQIY